MDIIKILDDAFCRMRYGTGARLAWSSSTWTGAHMEKMLLGQGVRVYWREYAVGDSTMYALRVPTHQENWARELAWRKGIATEGDKSRRRQTPSRQGAVPQQRRRDGRARPGVNPVGLAGRVLKLLW